MKRRERYERPAWRAKPYDVFASSGKTSTGWYLGPTGVPQYNCGTFTAVSDTSEAYYDFPLRGDLKGNLFYVSQNGPHEVVEEKSKSAGRFAAETYLARLREQGEKVVKVSYTKSYRYTVRSL